MDHLINIGDKMTVYCLFRRYCEYDEPELVGIFAKEEDAKREASIQPEEYDITWVKEWKVQ